MAFGHVKYIKMPEMTNHDFGGGAFHKSLMNRGDKASKGVKKRLIYPSTLSDQLCYHMGFLMFNSLIDLTRHGSQHDTQFPKKLLFQRTLLHLAGGFGHIPPYPGFFPRASVRGKREGPTEVQDHLQDVP